MESVDYLIIGGGIIGLAIARELRAADASASITVLEKEELCGQHASGRNSGVLHAGFYYDSDSLKARFAREGNLLMQDFCREHKLPLERCGKLVVARSPEELPALDELLRRGAANGVPIEELSCEEARKIDPRAKTCQRALYSPSTATVDAAGIVRALACELEKKKVKIQVGEHYRSQRDGTVTSSVATYAVGKLINCAGLYADRVAHDFAMGKHYRIMPFKGYYLHSTEPSPFRSHIYPVPDLKFPFLGVHLTQTLDGGVKIGPTALPALWREQYGGWERFRWREMMEIAGRQAGFFLRGNARFRELAWSELQKGSQKALVREAAGLAEGVDPRLFTRWGRPGIRAQLVDMRDRRLVMDFVIEQDSQSLHVLNAVSPGFTCALSFAKHVVQQLTST